MKKLTLLFSIIAVIVATWYAFGGGPKPPTSESSAKQQTPVVAISALLSAPKKYDKKLVTVSGIVSRECPAGCWWYVKDTGGEIRVSSGQGLTIKLHQEGHKIQTTGTLVKTDVGNYELDAVTATLP